MVDSRKIPRISIMPAGPGVPLAGKRKGGRLSGDTFESLKRTASSTVLARNIPSVNKRLLFLFG